MTATDDVVALLAALSPAPVTVVRDGDDVIVATAPDELVAANGDDAFAALDRAERDGFWVGYLAYELGRAIERITPRRAGRAEYPDLVLGRHEARIVCSSRRGMSVVGRGPARCALEQAVARTRAGACEPLPPPVATAPWRSSLTRDAHASRVDAVHALLDAGDCYQVNLTRRLTLDERLDPIALFAAVHEHHHAPHAALLTFDGSARYPAVVCASPELFLRCDRRLVETHPIKGTAPDAATLSASAKDRAENVMIVDLARNDFGRVCEPGSVVVPSLCAIEPHPGLHHLVSTVRGRRREQITLGGLVRATFPPASVTGAPKPRVLQAIEDLEPVPRGVYCGAVGWIDGERARSEWAVAIRTFTMTAGTTTFGVGGGIVADSRAALEWDETELKASRLLGLVAPLATVGSAP